MTENMTMREAALTVVETLTNAGFEAFVCGGAVRDTLLGQDVKDWDVCSVASSEEVSALFPNNFDFVGAHFGVSLVKFGKVTVEVAQFRADGEYSDGRRPDSVEFVRTAAEDVLRRDFTVNALLMKADGTVVDHVGGVEDLNNRVLRCV